MTHDHDHGDGHDHGDEHGHDHGDPAWEVKELSEE
jgi:hypothetical protein